VTNEVLALLADWNFLGDDRVILQIGCGIGPFRGAVAGAVDCATEENFSELFRRFFLLHRARWAERGEPGILADPQLEQFHLEAAGAFLERNMLRLYVLYVAENIAGAIYTFTHRRRAYCYLAGFDPRYKPFSPGTLLIAHTIERALAEHCESVDFLRGNEAYKYFGGPQDQATYRRAFFRGEKN